MTNLVDPERALEQAVEDILDQLEKQIRSPRGPAVPAARRIAASPQATDRVHTREVQVLNAGELKSITALLAYIAHNENIQQKTVEAIVEASFGVDHITRIPHKDYDEVIRFLVDLRIDEMRH